MSARKLAATTCSLLGLVGAPAAAAADVSAPTAVYELPLEVPAEEVTGNTVPLAPADAEAIMARAANRARQEHGLQPLRRSRSLARSARRYAAWMLRADYFGHLPRIRASRRFRRLGENLAIRFEDTAVASEVEDAARRDAVEETISGWLGSPGHRRLLLSRRYTRIGAGCAAGLFRGRPATTWVLHFGA